MLKKITNPSDRALLHLIAAVLWVFSAVILFCINAIQASSSTTGSAILFERTAFLNAHDCEEHLRLSHTPATESDAVWAEVEERRNQQHRQLCEKLKQSDEAFILKHRTKRVQQPHANAAGN